MTAVQRLRMAALEHLRARIAEPLGRHAIGHGGLVGTCAHCRELSHFLADPDRQRWTFKAPETGRRHLEESIQRSGCDLDLVTDRRGRPTAWCVRRTRRVTTGGRNSVSTIWPIWHRLRRRRDEC